MISDIPLSERPRERLLQSSGEALSLTELLAIILGSGTRGKSVLHLAEELLAHFGSLDALLHASIPELTAHRGIGPAKAVQLKASFALALRYRAPRGPVKSNEEIFHLIRDQFGEEEALMVILKNVKGLVFHTEIIARGTLTEVLVHPREVFHIAIKHKAHTLAIAHNHPSGDPTPSSADRQLTYHLRKAGHLVGIPLTEHYIITPHAYELVPLAV